MDTQRACVTVVEGIDEDGKPYADLQFPQNTPSGPWLIDFASGVLDQFMLEVVRNVTTSKGEPKVRIGFARHSLFTPMNEDFTATLSRIGNTTLGIHLDFKVQPREEATV